MLFSIIVSVYNVEKYLVKCLESIINQSNCTKDDFEVIVVYDKCDDDSLKIVNNYSGKFKNDFTIINNEIRQGLGPSRNSGLKVARGEYIIFIDGDDWIEPNYILNVKEEISKNSHPDLIRINYFKDTDRSSPVSTHTPECVGNNDKIRSLILTDELGSQSWLNVCKKELYDGIIFPNSFYEDLPVTYQLFYKAKTIVLSEFYLYHYVQRNDSLSYIPSAKKGYGSYKGFKSKLLFSLENKLITETTVLLKKYFLSARSSIHCLSFDRTKSNVQLIKEIAREVICFNRLYNNNARFYKKNEFLFASFFPRTYSLVCKIFLKIRRKSNGRHIIKS